MQEYSIIEVLGFGSYGQVYKAQCNNSTEIVAIKKIEIKGSSWNEYHTSNEVKALRKLKNNDHIIKLKDVLKQTDNYFLIFEYAEMSIRNVLEKATEYEVNIPESVIKEVIYETVLGLNYIHKNGIMHRDMKPDNILIKDKIIKIADFGFATEINDESKTEYICTRNYRAPECILCFNQYGHQIDIWAIGVIMLELYLKKNLFTARNELEQIAKISEIIGSPNKEDWPEGFSLMQKTLNSFQAVKGIGLDKIDKRISSNAIDLLKILLSWNPKNRQSTGDILNHAYFNDLNPKKREVNLKFLKSKPFISSNIEIMIKDKFEQEDKKNLMNNEKNLKTSDDKHEDKSKEKVINFNLEIDQMKVKKSIKIRKLPKPTTKNDNDIHKETQNNLNDEISSSKFKTKILDKTTDSKNDTLFTNDIIKDNSANKKNNDNNENYYSKINNGAVNDKANNSFKRNNFETLLEDYKKLNNAVKRQNRNNRRNINDIRNYQSKSPHNFVVDINRNIKDYNHFNKDSSLLKPSINENQNDKPNIFNNSRISENRYITPDKRIHIIKKSHDVSKYMPTSEYIIKNESFNTTSNNFQTEEETFKNHQELDIKQIENNNNNYYGLNALPPILKTENNNLETDNNYKDDNSFKKNKNNLADKTNANSSIEKNMKERRIRTPKINRYDIFSKENDEIKKFLNKKNKWMFKFNIGNILSNSKMSRNLQEVYGFKKIEDINSSNNKKIEKNEIENNTKKEKINQMLSFLKCKEDFKPYNK